MTNARQSAHHSARVQWDLPTSAPMTAPLLYFEIAPPPDLEPLVIAFWGFEVRHGAPHSHTLWPDASISVTWGVNGGRTTVLAALGARSAPMSVPVRPGDSYRGIRFWPDVLRPLRGADPAATREARLPLAALGAMGARLEHAVRETGTIDQAFPVFESAIRPSLGAGAEIDALVRRALRGLDARPDCPIGRMASELGSSDRQLRRRFTRATGLSPKAYARIRRLRHALVRAAEGSDGWSMIAAGAGFSDQPHLVNEIVRMTACTPVTLQRRLRIIEHLGVTP